MTPGIVVLGAGFGGLELATLLSETFGDELDLTLIDRSDHFIFGFSKLDVMFGRQTPDAVRLAYSNILKPGVRFRQESILEIDPTTRRVTTDAATYDADVLVVALGADYDLDATPGLAQGGNEFYSVQGAEDLREVLPGFSSGHAIVGVAGAPFKCPPAPSEAALMLHDFLTQRGLRGACEISLVMPFGTPIPPAPGASQALIAAFAERGIAFVPNRLVRSLEPGRRVAVLDDGSELNYDLFLGIPKHRAPAVVESSGLAVDGWIPVDPRNLMTRFPGVFAIGDVTSVGTPKAGVFAEGAAQVVAAALIAQIRGEAEPEPYSGAGSCYVEFGGNEVGRVDVDFLSGPSPTGTFVGASTELVREKQHFGASRRQRWFGIT
ncbi:MAG TPA: FAD-dependent oxidoreductase [Dehalococcoidia bacterium]|nr:FAD-dependent oxidoreductase [Dehalococcoidia bacterium]